MPYRPRGRNRRRPHPSACPELKRNRQEEVPLSQLDDVSGVAGLENVSAHQACTQAAEFVPIEIVHVLLDELRRCLQFGPKTVGSQRLEDLGVNSEAFGRLGRTEQEIERPTRDLLVSPGAVALLETGQ